MWSYRPQDAKDQLYAEDHGPKTVDDDSGGGGSIDATIAYVRPAPIGNDATGSIGGTPFLTVQVAIDAFVALASETPGVIDIGANHFEEDLTIEDEISLLFKGAGADSVAGPTASGGFLSIPWTSLTLTAAATIYIKDCALGSGGFTTNNNLNLLLENVDMNSVTIVSTAGIGKHLTVISPSNSAYNSAGVTADDIERINFIGIMSTDGGADINVATSSPEITIKNCGIPSTNSQNTTWFDIDCGGSPGIMLINSTVRNITAADGYVTLVNSKAIGTVTAAGVIDDSTLPTSDPGVAGKEWVDTAADFVIKVSQGPP